MKTRLIRLFTMSIVFLALSSTCFSNIVLVNASDVILSETDVEFPIEVRTINESVGLSDEYNILGNSTYTFSSNSTHYFYSVQYDIFNHTITNSSYTLNSWMIGIKDHNFYINVQNHEIEIFLLANNTGIFYAEAIVTTEPLESLMFGMYFTYRDQYSGSYYQDHIVEVYKVSTSELATGYGNDVIYELTNERVAEGKVYFITNNLSFSVAYHLSPVTMNPPEFTWSVSLLESNFTLAGPVPNIGFYLSYNFHDPGKMPNVGIRESHLELFPTLSTPGDDYVDQFKIEPFEGYDYHSVKTFEIMVNMEGLPNFQIFFKLPHTIWEKPNIYVFLGIGLLFVGGGIGVYIKKRKNQP